MEERYKEEGTLFSSPAPSSRRMVSCVICAYNERGRIGNVLAVAARHPLIDEVVVVDDGSQDGTIEDVGCYSNVKVIKHSHNLGKSAAIATGISEAGNDLIMLLDADLTGLTELDLERLLMPVMNREVAMAISLRENAFGVHKMLGLDFTSGERVFVRELVGDHLDDIRQLPGFGFEAFLNSVLLKRGYTLKVVRWRGVTHARKREKVGLIRGLLAELRMVIQIRRTMSLRSMIMQNYALLAAARRRRSLRARDLP